MSIQSGTLHLKPGTKKRRTVRTVNSFADLKKAVNDAKANRTPRIGSRIPPKNGTPKSTSAKPHPVASRNPDTHRAFQFLFENSPTWRKGLPMAVGFHREALAAVEGTDIPRTRIRRLIGQRAGTPGYLKTVANSAVRYDFSGQPAGEVSQQERDYSIRQLNALKKQPDREMGDRWPPQRNTERWSRPAGKTSKEERDRR